VGGFWSCWRVDFLSNLLNLMLKFFPCGDEFSNSCFRTECLIEFVPPFNLELSEETHWKFVCNTVVLSDFITPAEDPWNLEFFVKLHRLYIVQSFGLE